MLKYPERWMDDLRNTADPGQQFQNQHLVDVFSGIRFYPHVGVTGSWLNQAIRSELGPSLFVKA